MADRYDDYERGRRTREERDRGDWSRQEPYNRGRWGRNWEESGEGYGGGEGDRERRGSYGGEYGGRSEYGNRGEFGGRGGEYGGRGEFGGRGGEYGGRGEFGNRGEYGGREGYGGREYSGGRGEYGGRGSQGRGYEGQHDWGRGQGEWGRGQSEWGRGRSGNEGLFGTGSQGFGTGYRSGDYSSQGGAYGGFGSYTGYGSSGSESYGGGAGMYGQQGQQQGRYSGRGPKGYQRSDDRIREDVCERLTHHPEVDASEIEINVKEGEVTLTGTVEERQAKRMAEDVAEGVSGVKDVRNQIQVRQHQMAGAQHGRSESGTEQRSGSEKTTSTQKR